ncbi:MAG: transposase [Bacteroidetes bacterium]|nr:MAG: transposase [Bacteroidota bacterium]
MAKYNPNIHHRKSIRLKGYDYSQSGLYFVTIVCQNREHLFGKIVDDHMILNDAGIMVKNEWLKLTERFPNIQLHESIIMPNHFHLILEIVNQNENTVGATLVVAPNNDMVGQNQKEESTDYQKWQPQGIAPTENPTEIQNKKTLGDIVGAFQSITTVEYIRGVKTKNWKPFDKKIWQRNYWEHIIRNNKSYNTISKYIKNNPNNWDNDKFCK